MIARHLSLGAALLSVVAMGAGRRSEAPPATATSSETRAAAEDWPQFRGPRGDGVTAASGLPLSWSEKKNVTWKTELPGEGWSFR